MMQREEFGTYGPQTRAYDNKFSWLDYIYEWVMIDEYYYSTDCSTQRLLSTSSLIVSFDSIILPRPFDHPNFSLTSIQQDNLGMDYLTQVRIFLLHENNVLFTDFSVPKIGFSHIWPGNIRTKQLCGNFVTSQAQIIHRLNAYSMVTIIK